MDSKGHSLNVVVRGFAEGQGVNCLIDTGSHVTLVNSILVKHLNVQDISANKHVLTSFTDNRINTLGEVNLTLGIAGVNARHTCIVVKDSMECDILLGMDFIGKYGLCVNGKDRTVTSYSGFSKFISLPTHVVKRIKVRSKITVTIPPNSVSFVKATVVDQDRKLKHDTVYSGHFEPYRNLIKYSCN